MPKIEHRSNHCALTYSILGASNGWAKSLVLSNGDVYFRPRMGKNASFAQQRAVVLSPGDRDEGVVPQKGSFWGTEVRLHRFSSPGLTEY